MRYGISIVVGVAVALLSACSGAQKPEPIRLIDVDRSCLDEAELGPPPVPEPEVSNVAGPEDGCPDKFTICLPRDAALALEKWLRQVLRWMDEAEAVCRAEGGETP